MEPLGRFYTEPLVSHLMVSNFRQPSPKRILDLGVGSGSLLHAAYLRWENAFFFAADIDRDRMLHTSSHLSFATFQHIDGLSATLPEKLNLKVGSIDVAVCNPPYIRLERSPDTMKLLQEGGLEGCSGLKRVTSDVVFLAQNLQMLRNGGELGIILPDGIFTGIEFREFREELIRYHTILGVIQLPDNIFKRTEARTHILLLEKGTGTFGDIPLFGSYPSGHLTPAIYIKPDEASKRMDYEFYKWKEKYHLNLSQLTLKQTGAEIKRGRNTRKFLHDSGLEYFHTTCFPESSGKILLDDQPYKKGNNAQAGDILVARVGKRCIGKTAIVASGNLPITDCVYRIRVSKPFRKAVWDSFNSNYGREWMKAHAHGVCSRCISKQDLLEFPITVCC